RRHTRCYRDWSSDVCSSDLLLQLRDVAAAQHQTGAGGEIYNGEIDAAIGNTTGDFGQNAGTILDLLHQDFVLGLNGVTGFGDRQIGRASCRESEWRAC